MPDAEVVAPHLRVGDGGEAVRERGPHRIGQHVRQAEADVEAERTPVPERRLDLGRSKIGFEYCVAWYAYHGSAKRERSGGDHRERPADRTALALDA